MVNPARESRTLRAHVRYNYLIRLAAVALVLVLASSSVSANTIAGRASVIDGDTIDIHGERIRILDIDAPESQQTCRQPSGISWRCGREAALRLSAWIGKRVVVCETDRKDLYQQWLARCESGGADLAEWLASRGWAVPYRECKCEVLRDLSQQAKNLRIGIWSGTFMMPWEWRTAN